MSGTEFFLRFAIGFVVGFVGVALAVRWLYARYTAKASLRRISDWLGITPKPRETDAALRERLREQVFSTSVASTRAEIAFLLNSLGCDGYMSEKDCILYVVPRSLGQWPDASLSGRLPIWIDLKVVQDRDRVPVYATPLRRRAS